MEDKPRDNLILSAYGVVHYYQNLLIINKVSLQLQPCESVALVSPSGAGKSTLLRLLLSLEKPTEGQISLFLKPSQVGAAFQEDNLLPWLNVTENVCLLNQLHKRKIDQLELERILQMFNLESFQSYFPWQLSGGMKQKVAVARLLLYKPMLYVLDESMANMDDLSRFALCDALYSEVNRGSSILFITHNLTDALHLANRVLVGSQRPLNIVKEFKSPLPRQRDYTIRFTEDFYRAMEELRGCIGQL